MVRSVPLALPCQTLEEAAEIFQQLFYDDV